MPHQSASEIGNKAANLQELSSVCPDNVPAFCPLNDVLVKSHLDDYAPTWRSLWAEFKIAQSDDKSDIHANAKPILRSLRKLILDTFQNYPLDNVELSTFLKNMKEQKAMLMVRSTGEEDTVDVANPGGNESVAAVLPDIESVSKAMGQVVASYFSEKSLKQRLLSSPNDITQETFVPVLLQKMIGEPMDGFHYSKNVIRSGVMYTSEGITRIQVAPGHGELVVNSKGLFDTFSVTRENVVYSEVAKKQYRLVPTKDGLKFKKNPEDLQNSASISRATALKIAQLGREIEQHYGIPMDVEFIYDAKHAVLSVVQARPIPAGKTKVILPSSVPPSKMSELNQAIKDGTITQCKTQMITPAGFAARIITNADQVLVCNTIEQALTQYLAQKNSPVKAVIVQAMAPATAHEAAQFNAMGIPVVQINDLNAVTDWLKNTNQTLMIDPQRNQILNCTSMIQDISQATDELEKAGFLEEGLFTYPVSPLTILPFFVHTKAHQKPTEPDTIGDLIQQDPEKALQRLFGKLNPKVTLDKVKGIYSQLLHNIDLLEAVQAKDKNEEAFTALDTIRYIFYRLAKAEPNILPLCPHVMMLCEEIESSISKYSSKEQLEEHLNLVSRLKSLVSSPGNQSVISNSVLQVLQEKKASKRIDTAMRQGFSAEQSEYLTQFSKLDKIANNEANKNAWSDLVMHSLSDAESTQKLASIVKFYVEHHLEMELINADVPEIIQNASSLSTALQTLHERCMQAKQEFEILNLDEKLSIIHAWETRIHEWADPDKFDGLWHAYEKEVVPLINALQFDAGGKMNTRLTQNAILDSVLQLTELMDKTIKSLKGSPSYLSQHITTVINRFGTLLKPYHQLMAQWIISVSDEQVQKWYLKMQGQYNTDPQHIKKIMIEGIESKLKESLFDRCQLNPSGHISVASCKLGSGANFYRQFMRNINSVTLEDIFSLIHQNILSAVSAVRIQRHLFRIESLPPELRPILEAFNQKIMIEQRARPEYGSPETMKEMHMDLIAVHQHFPITALEYNMCMRNHSAIFTIEYNQHTQMMSLKGNVFGHNDYNRMNHLAYLILFESQIYTPRVIKPPIYQESTYSLEFVWEFSARELQSIAVALHSNFLDYDIVLDYFHPTAHMIDKRVRQLKQFAAIPEKGRTEFIDQYFEFSKNGLLSMPLDKARKSVIEIIYDLVPEEERAVFLDKHFKFIVLNLLHEKEEYFDNRKGILNFVPEGERLTLIKKHVDVLQSVISSRTLPLTCKLLSLSTKNGDAELSKKDINDYCSNTSDLESILWDLRSIMGIFPTNNSNVVQIPALAKEVLTEKALAKNIKKIIKNEKELASFIENLVAEKDRYAVDDIRTIFINGIAPYLDYWLADWSDIAYLMNHLNYKTINILITTLKPTINSFIQDGYQLAYLLEKLEKPTYKRYLLTSLDDTLLSIIENRDQLEFVLKELPQDVKQELVDLLDLHMKANQDNSKKTAKYRAELQEMRDESGINKQCSIQVKKS